MTEKFAVTNSKYFNPSQNICYVIGLAERKKQKLLTILKKQVKQLMEQQQQHTNP